MKFTIIILLFIFSFSVSAQEYLVGLHENPTLIKYDKAEDSNLKSATDDVLTLPFFDDFLQGSPFPKQDLWVDDEVYINSNYGYNSLTRKVATMDVVDENGLVYSFASPYPFEADHLTSHPINLDSIYDPEIEAMRELLPSDSVYLSFYYQPQGFGVEPSVNDSLVLQFGTYSGDSVFSHYDSVLVWGSQYLENEDDYILPNSFLISPCYPEDTLLFEIQDTLFFDGSTMAPCDSVFSKITEWENIWSAKGGEPGDTISAINEFYNNEGVYFKRVALPIIDTSWLKSGFQFRFVNYGSVSDIPSWKSNTDHWNIDLIYLNLNRTYEDVILNQIVFSKEAESFIKPYTSMPMRHFFPYYMNDSVSVFISNLDVIDYDISYNYKVFKNGNELSFENSYNLNIPSLYDLMGGGFLPSVEYSPTEYFYASNDDSVFYTIQHSFSDVSGVLADTLTYQQKFYNYFSYDDGTAEAGYVITPGGAMAAMEFELEYPDTLRGVQIYFNHVLNNANNRSFTLGVWNDFNGKPGNILAVQENVKPFINNNSPNSFISFEFDSLILLGADKFYIGWIQNSNYGLNMGFDKNINSKDRLFYNVDGTWRKSSYNGTLMIRPMVGTALSDNVINQVKVSEEILLYPNPAGINQLLRVVLPTHLQDPEQWDKLEVHIYNIYGQEIYFGPYSETLPVSDFNQGIYIYSVFNTAMTKSYSTKLIIR